MKRTSIFLIILAISFSQYRSHAQVTLEKMDKDQFVFWFYIRAEIKIDRITKRPAYVIRTMSRTPKSGTIEKYEKDVWRNMQSGQQLPVGPFLEFQDVKRAIGMYDLARHTDETMKKEIANFKDSTAANEYYWFLLKYRKSKRKNKYIFDRTAANVATGGIKEFKELLWEGLSFEQLAIGPFATRVEAEHSKWLYRLEEK